ncbi:MAG: ABC transporter permease [Eubacterium sp.]|jgi:putative ABC transport system permease protein|nr:ABC transporter permease [Eubacterium sp.]
MLENIRLSLKGIWSHKMRSFLTMLGIIIGIAAIIAIVSTIQGTNEQIKENLIGAGDNTVEIALYQGDWVYEMGGEGIPEGVPVIDEKTLGQVKDIDHVEDASLYLSRQDYGAVYYLNTALSGGSVVGADRNYFNTCSFIIQKGRGFTERDYTEFRKVALLDKDSADVLFQGEDPLGKTIEIKKEPFTIIGILSKSKEFEPVINSIDDYYTYAQESAGKVYVPDTVWPIIYQFDEPQNLIVKVDSTDSMTNAGKEGASILNARLNPSDDTMEYKAEDLLEQARKIQELSESTNSMLIWIAGISLIVGGIGVMNIMLVSVTERTQEIGLKKAIGARKSNILGQFLTEAAVLTSMGGIIGVISGIVLAEVISKVSEMPVAINIPAAVGSVLFSMIIGIVFGMLPSYKAANLDPIEALRHE